jgi:hypothetical protein
MGNKTSACLIKVRPPIRLASVIYICYTAQRRDLTTATRLGSDVSSQLPAHSQFPNFSPFPSPKRVPAQAQNTSQPRQV